MGVDNVPKRRIKSIDTSFAIIELLQQLDGATVTELANRLDLSKSTVHTHLSTLELMEYVVKEDGVYRLGLKFLDHGVYVKQQKRLCEVSQPELDEVARKTQEVVWLVVEEHGKAVRLSRSTGDHGVSTIGRVGGRSPLHSISSGKAILAHMPSDRVDEIIEASGLPALTEETITSPEQLREELQTIRKQGVAFSNGESVSGERAVASPIVVDGEVYGAISVAGPAQRLRGDRFQEEIPEIILGATNAIELSLRY